MSASWYERGEAVRERWLWFYDAVGGTGDRDDMMTLALEMLAASEAVVAVQREALRLIRDTEPWSGAEATQLQNSRVLARRALDAEGVSEPGTRQGRESGQGASTVLPDPGSLTSPVPTMGTGVDPSDVHRVPFKPRETSPVDTAPVRVGPRGVLPAPKPAGPRGYVTSTADGPVGVYHAETPDTYLAHGDRP